MSGPAPSNWASLAKGSGPAAPPAAAAAGINDRTTYLYVNLIGTSVLVETDKGAVWEGLFSSVSQGEVALQSARLCVTPSIDANAPAFWVDNLKLPMNTVVSISAPGNASVPCGQVTAAANVKKVVPQVQTPSEPIDWAADSDDETLEQAEKKYVPGTFDQFNVNERKFGVKSTYKETDYTTDLNQRQYSNEERARADKLTREINRAATTSEAHRIERGLDSNVDEGTLYSDVKRGVDSQHHSNSNSMPPRGSKPSTPASSGVALPSGSSGSWAEQQRLKKAGKSAMGTPANSSNPVTPTVPAPASAAKKPSAFEAPSVPVSNAGATKPITSPLQANPTSPAAATPAPKKSTLSATAMAFNVSAAPWTPGGGGGAPVAPPAILNDILGGTMAIRFLVNKEVDASAFPWMDHPSRGGGGDVYHHHQQPYHQQPRDHHHGGGGRGGGNNYDYNPQHQHHHHAHQHVQVASHHSSHHGAQHQHHHQHQHQSSFQHHNSHHHGGHQQHHGGSSYNNGPRQPFNGGGGERGGSAPPQPHSHPADMGTPSTHHMPPPQQQQHAPASIGRGAGIPPQANDGPQVSTVMRGRGRGRATGGGVN